MSNPEQHAANLAQLVKQVIEQINTPQQAEYRRMKALTRRADYLAHLDAGFDSSQALELCK